MKINNLNEMSREDLLAFKNDIEEELCSRDMTENLYNINNVLRTVVEDYHPYFDIKTPINGTINYLQLYYDSTRNVITAQFSKF